MGSAFYSARSGGRMAVFSEHGSGPARRPQNSPLPRPPAGTAQQSTEPAGRREMRTWGTGQAVPLFSGVDQGEDRPANVLWERWPCLADRGEFRLNGDCTAFCSARFKTGRFPLRMRG